MGILLGAEDGNLHQKIQQIDINVVGSAQCEGNGQRLKAGEIGQEEREADTGSGSGDYLPFSRTLL